MSTKIEDIVKAEFLEDFTSFQIGILNNQLERHPFHKWPFLTEDEWRPLRGCGVGMVDKLIILGWCIMNEKTGLSTRALSQLRRRGINISKDDVRVAIANGSLNRGSRHDRTGIGKKIRNELRRWCGLGDDPENDRKWKFDPFTGKPLVIEEPRWG